MLRLVRLSVSLPFRLQFREAHKMAKADSWSPAQYTKFQSERDQPFFDLAALLKPVDQPTIVDLGCGTGHLTKWLHETKGASHTLGIDSSAAMLSDARKHETETLKFALQDIETVQPSEKYDVVFSNAALHWLPDHKTLFPRIVEMAKPGGQIAIQIPSNHDYPTHTIAQSLAAEEPYASWLKGFVQEYGTLTPEAYASLFAAVGATEIHVRLQGVSSVLSSFCREFVCLSWLRLPRLIVFTTFAFVSLGAFSAVFS